MLKKKKRCSNCKQECFLWGKQLCKKCFSALYPPKPIKKVSKKGIEKKSAKKIYLEAQFKLFEEHWNTKPHYCESCGKWLGKENLSVFHDHLIEKSKRKDIALDIRNLYLVCFDCHSSRHNGFPTEKHKKAIELAKQIFNYDY